MDVAFVSMYTDHDRNDGATRRTQQTAELLATRGHEVTILCSQWWDGDIDAFERRDVTYRAVTDGPMAGTFASKLPFVLRSVDPEVVQVASTPPSQAVAAISGARLLRVPVVVDWYDTDPSASRLAYRRVARGADAIVTPSRLVKRQIREFGAPEDAVSVVPDPIDMDLVRESPVDERADMLFAHRLDADANVESFFLALAELRSRGWRAAVIGDGPDRADAEQMARDLRIDDRVEFLGDLPIEEAVPVMKGAKVFAQTATREPFADTLLWALACGCVGIVEYQTQSSAHELVENRSRGVRVTSPQELADEIVQATQVPHQTVNEEVASFDQTPVLEQYLELYRTLMAEKGLF